MVPRVDLVAGCFKRYFSKSSASTPWLYDYGLWEIEDDVVNRSEEPIEITNCSGNLSVGDGVMLLAGHYGAALHNGTGRTRLFSIAELERQVKQSMSDVIAA